MSYILDIATAVPGHTIEKTDLERFYSEAAGTNDNGYFLKKLSFLNRKTMIRRRHSCIPDYNGTSYELYKNGNYKVPVEERMALYKTKILPLATSAIDKLVEQAGVKPAEVTHLITVSCTGLFAPGFEFLVTEHYGFHNIERTAINFSGCYAALKGLKQAHYIANSEPGACVLVVCAELCSLHFYPSFADEDIVANLLFSDGAAAMLVCGEESPMVKDKVVLKTDALGSAIIPGTGSLMTWEISSSAFRMFLSKNIVNAIKQNIQPVIKKFLEGNEAGISSWAIHPGGVKIVEAVQEAMGLSAENVKGSMNILTNYGNMSSPTILFILQDILNGFRDSEDPQDKKVFACAFGPGINIEMIGMTCINTGVTTKTAQAHGYAVQV